ncbi:DUF3108 domain-containing protein [Piscinibacter sp.]|uniref:DUF3108 domain-containing protein n=1 Tax=Piscinibacter sp. TaxID=1903157 RepID=UPI001D77B364|nr:DUF3108 domain-containing protein [Piscinibacter sp.]MBK7529608.1 DUF3108 domain-containing protein [Piscinibacter sp.]
MAHALSALSTPRRRIALAALALAVLAVHGWLTDELADRMASLDPAQAMPIRIEVAYVRELELAAPPALAPAPPPATPKPKRRPQAAKPAASAPEAVALMQAAPEPAPEPEPVPPPPPPEPAPQLAAAPEPVASAPAPVLAAAPPSAAASGAFPFEWPASTRLSYKLSGNVRGEVHGDAQVEWVRQGSRYQVHLDLTVGIPIAPMITRRMSSDGDLTELGLAPRRYDEDTKVMFANRRRLTMLFEPDAVLMPNGERRPRFPGTQDTASQFVQLSWIFTTRPELLRTGNTVDFALALPRSVDRWVYDVLEEEPVATSFGAVNAFHLKPRRVSRPGGELVAEVWFAPQLRYLPARIRIEQDRETFIDLVLSRRPELAGP